MRRGGGVWRSRSTLLENLAGLAAPEDEVERGHRDADLSGEPLHPRLDFEVPLRGQCSRKSSKDAMANQVPEDVTVQDREVLSTACVPEEMACLLEAQAGNF